MNAPDQPYLSRCPSCGADIDVTTLEPFAKIACPHCKTSVRVRRKFDHFVIIKQIGEGGMSRVFEAEDETLGRRVALKILNRTYSRDAARMAQFQQEALITARVTHPNVIKLYSVGYDQGHFFIAMELVNGGSLEQRIKKDGIVQEKDSLRIGRQVAEGLRAAFRMGLLHRDVKPANILFTEDGTAKVVDFGLALFADRKDESGEIWATPYYVSPEKVIDNHEDFRSDLFSLGATLYHAMTGKAPHKANSNSIHELRMIKCRRVSLEDTGMPFAPRTVHVIDSLLAFKPEERPESYDAAVDELRLAEGLTGRTIMTGISRRRLLAMVTAGALLLAYGIGWAIKSLTTPATVNITTSTPLDQFNLNGNAKTVAVGEKTIADLYAKALDTLLKKGDFKQAEKEFEEILASGNKVVLSTLNKTRYNALICAIIAGNRSRAERLIADLARDSRDTADPSASFHRKLSAHLKTNLGLALRPNELDYNEHTEEVMGYLAHGLVEWHFGSPQEASRLLDRFLMSRQTDPSLDWVDQYRVLIGPYAEDRKLASSLDRFQKNMPADEATALLKEYQSARKQLRTQGTIVSILDANIGALQKTITSHRLATERQELKDQLAHRQRELDQLSELGKSLPSLVRGYDFSPAVSILKEMQFESPEVKNALDGKLYLYQGAQTFMSQLFADIASRGWTGRLARTSGTPVDGRLTAMSMKEVSVMLPRGAVTIPLDQVAPETLIELAQFFLKDVSDSSEYYRRQEQIAIFARMEERQAIANEVASQLMEENRPFRSRWLKVLQGGI